MVRALRAFLDERGFLLRHHTIAVDLTAAALSNRNAVWDLNPSHFSERHGLFVIIALGESMIVAGTAVAAEERATDLVLVAGASLTVACLLWWTYFGWLKEAMEEAFLETPAEEVGPVARDAFSLTHFPLICGIIGFAGGTESVFHHLLSILYSLLTIHYAPCPPPSSTHPILTTIRSNPIIPSV